jgi:homospermidine synthase
MKHVAFGGRLVMLGFGSIGQGVLPLILRHIDMPRDRSASCRATCAARISLPSMAWRSRCYR